MTAPPGSIILTAAEWRRWSRNGASRISGVWAEWEPEDTMTDQEKRGRLSRDIAAMHESAPVCTCELAGDPWKAPEQHAATCPCRLPVVGQENDCLPAIIADTP